MVDRSLIAPLATRWSGGGRRDRARLTAQVPEAARALSRAYAAGLPFPTACRRAADSLEEPAAAVLRQAAADAERGRPAADALTPLAAASGGALVRGAVAINAELGGDLVRALDALADGLDDRERLRGEIAVATAQARFAARIVPPFRRSRC